MNNLLKILDMSEAEQIHTLWNSKNQYLDIIIRTKLEFGHISLADLAFRLRNEVIEEDDKSEIDCWWCEASYEVYLYVIGEENEMEAKEGLDTWFTMRAKPIHWIITALIAKNK